MTHTEPTATATATATAGDYTVTLTDEPGTGYYTERRYAHGQWFGDAMLTRPRGTETPAQHCARVAAALAAAH